MKITNTLSVKMNWDSFTFPILVGTPVSTAGVLANSAAAVGIVPRTVKQKPDAGDEFYLMTGGSVYLSEIAYTDLSVAAMQELDGIDFYKQNGHVQQKGGSGGGGLTPEQEALIQNAQWKTEGTLTTLFTQIVETSLHDGFYGALFTYNKHITDDTITVTFDGVDYVCHKTEDPGLGNSYGASINPEASTPGDLIDFSEYPFVITSVDDGIIQNSIMTENAGIHTVSVAVPTTVYINGFDDGVKANVPKAVYQQYVDSTEPVSGETFINLLEALETAGLLEWDEVS